MCIKYSDCSNGYKYDADGKQLANWDPDCDYGNEYVDVYFRMDTKGYGYPSFCFSEEDGAAFDEEIVKVFTSLGWKCAQESYNGRCSTWCNGKSRLYLHPQNFSGEVLKNEVKTVAEALENNITFKLRWVDLYETVYDMSDEVYEELLSTKDEEIKKVILDKCRTTRTNKFLYPADVAYNIAALFRIKRVSTNDGKNGGVGQTTKHILTIIDSLVKEGYLVSAEVNGHMLIRTINKTEQKQRKLFIA